MQQPRPEPVRPDIPDAGEAAVKLSNSQDRAAKRKTADTQRITNSMKALGRAYDALAQTDHLVKRVIEYDWLN